MFLTHMGLAMSLTIDNKDSKGQTYAVSASGDKGTSFVQKSMIHQGMILLIFVVWHLITFKFGPYYEYTSLETGEVIRDLHKLLIEVFQSPLYVLGYMFCLLVLGLHLSHGVSSAIRTLGFNHPKYDPKVRMIGLGYAVLVMLGFMTQPIYVYFFS